MGFTLQDVQAYRPLVQNLFLGAKPGKMGMIARQLLPEINAELSGQIFDISPDDILRLYEDTTDDGVAEIYDFTPNLLTYDQRIRALKVNLSRRSRQGAQGPLKALMNMATAGMRLALDLRYEQRVATQLNDTSIYTSQAATAPIGNAGDAPVEDLLSAGDAVRQNLGMFPNTVIYAPDVFRRASASTKMQNYVASFRSNGADFGAFSTEMLAKALALAWGQQEVKVLVGGASANSAKKGQAKSMTNLWASGRIIVGYFEPKLPQFDQTRTDGLPVGSPAEVMEGVTTPCLSLMGPDHGKAKAYEGQESSDLFLRFEYDYALRTGVEEAERIITGS